MQYHTTFPTVYVLIRNTNQNVLVVCCIFGGSTYKKGLSRNQNFFQKSQGRLICVGIEKETKKKQTNKK